MYLTKCDVFYRKWSSKTNHGIFYNQDKKDGSNCKQHTLAWQIVYYLLPQNVLIQNSDNLVQSPATHFLKTVSSLLELNHRMLLRSSRLMHLDVPGRGGGYARGDERRREENRLKLRTSEVSPTDPPPRGPLHCDPVSKREKRIGGRPHKTEPMLRHVHGEGIGQVRQQEPLKDLGWGDITKIGR